jgi:hypothetical protein
VFMLADRCSSDGKLPFNSLYASKSCFFLPFSGPMALFAQKLR